MLRHADSRKWVQLVLRQSPRCRADVTRCLPWSLSQRRPWVLWLTVVVMVLLRVPVHRRWLLLLHAHGVFCENSRKLNCFCDQQGEKRKAPTGPAAGELSAAPEGSPALCSGVRCCCVALSVEAL